MTLEVDSNFHAGDIGETPFVFSMYCLKALKDGRIFDPSTFSASQIDGWVSTLVLNITEGVAIPSRLRIVDVQENLWNRLWDPGTKESFAKSLKEHDQKAFEKYLEEEREVSKKGIGELEAFLREREFPVFLWMEYNRFSSIYSEINCFFQELMLKIISIRPKQKSQIREKNRLAQISTHVYLDLINGYFSTLTNYYKLGLLMEVWSCKNEKEIFTAECIWNFDKVDKGAFETLFSDFHNAISMLEEAYLKLKPRKTSTARGREKPIDWAFKQLILMT
jgi:hypothetical protein